MKTLDAETGAIVLQVPEGLEPATEKSLKETFLTYFEQAEEWRSKALAIQVANVDDKESMKAAKAARLELKSIRCAAENARKKLKEDSLRKGRAIDGIYNMLEFAIKPLEDHLEAQEKYAVRLEVERMEKRRTERLAALEGLDYTPVVDLGQLTEDAWKGLLQDAKDLHELKKERERKAEEEGLAKEKSEAEERERMRIENEQLRAAAAKREAEIEAEKERMAIQQKAAEKLVAEQQAKANAERLAAEARAKAEREAAEAAAQVEREKREKAEAEAKKLREEQEARDKAEAEKAAAEARAKTERERKAKRAPDKAKIQSYADALLAIDLPDVKTDDALSVLAEIERRVEELSDWISGEVGKL
jgi:hypothetical protein